MSGATHAGTEQAPAPTEKLSRVVIRFAGDSGDGMQLTGDRFTAEAAAFGNDLATFPNYPAEIRAPAGTLSGVSSFQLHFADHDILTPGDRPDVLVAMNPAALRSNLKDLNSGGILIVNSDEFKTRTVSLAGYDQDPLTTTELDDFRLHAVPMTSMTRAAVEPLGVSKKDAERCKNLFALGLLCWMYSRPTERTEEWLRSKFSKNPEVAEANVVAFRAGFAFGETTESFAVSYEVAPAALQPGRYRQITGNTALSYGLVAAGEQAGIQVFLGSYPITPASDILHELSRLKQYNVVTFQAEDEIAAVGAAIGASYGGAIGVTSTSGPGLALKSEAIGLAVMIELPLVVVNVQRGGPSTGLPTKTEQADLLQAMFGRNGESPVPVVAASSPADAFDAAVEAVRIAIDYRTPVILLSDGAIANGSEPWRLPDRSSMPAINPGFATGPNAPDGKFMPYLRDADLLTRPWAIPGTAGLTHRVGGLEKADGTGEISYSPANHELMVRLREAKVEGISVPDLVVDDPEGSAETLVLGWGSTFGPIGAAARRLRLGGHSVATAHLRHLRPFPANTGEVLQRFKNVVVPEMNRGQLQLLLQGQFECSIRSISKVNGLPFTAEELTRQIESIIDGRDDIA